MTKKHRKQKKVELPQATVSSPLVEAETIISDSEESKVSETEPKVTKLAPGEGMDQPVGWRPKVEISYECECCGATFTSRRARQGERLCADCVGLRRALKGFLKHGVEPSEVIRRSEVLLGVE